MVSAFRWLEPWLGALFLYWKFPCFKIKSQEQHIQPQLNFLVVPMSTLELGKTTSEWEMIHHSESLLRTSHVENPSDSKSWRIY
jgi:hypothetical protein